MAYLHAIFLMLPTIFLLCFLGVWFSVVRAVKTYYVPRNRYLAYLVDLHSIMICIRQMSPLKYEVSGVLLRLVVARPITWHVIGFACFHII